MGVVSQAPHPPGISRDEDQQLGLLSILFYVYSGVTGLAALTCAGFVAAIAAFLPEMRRARGAPDPVLMSALMVILGAAGGLLLAKTVMMILAGRAFGRREGYVLAMVGACFALTSIPLGTALGVFAILTLMKPGVKARLSPPPAGG